MKTRNRLTILLTMITVAIALSMAFTGLVNSATIGDSTFKQAQGFDSNPTSLRTGNWLNIYPNPTDSNYNSFKDGDVSTGFEWRIGYYASTSTGYIQLTGFENEPSGYTIGWVDIKICYKVPVATIDDRYRIVYQVGASAWIELQTWKSGTGAKFDNYGAADERAWSKVAEPLDGSWSWADITSLKVRVETQRQGTTEDGSTRVFRLYEVWLTIYEGTYPPAGPGVTMLPSSFSGFVKDDPFYVDVYVTDVTVMHGFGFVIRFNPYVLGAGEYFAYNPFISMSPSETSDWTYLPVRYYDGARPGWHENGTAPFLRGLDYPDNFVNTTTHDAQTGDYYFSSTTSENFGRTVYIELNAIGDGDDQIEIWLNDGTVGAPWTKVDTITPPPTWDPIMWNSTVDVGQILNTKDKINNAKVYLVKKTVGDEGEVIADAMRLRLGTGYAAVSFSSFMGDGVGFTGSGPVVRVYFTVKNDAMSPLYFDKATLSNVYGDAIVPNYVTSGLYVGPIWLSAVDGPATLNPIILPPGPPIGTKWHQIFPQYSRTSTLTSWTDNGDGILSASDQIDMTYDDKPGWLSYYHVDVVTTTIHWTFKPDGATTDPKYPGAAEPETPSTELPISPIGTRWHQIYPPESFCRYFTITSWTDNGDGHFDPSDQFDFEYEDTPGVSQWAHLDAVSTDIILTWKYDEPGGPVPEFPLGIGIVLALAPIVPLVYIRRLRKNKELKQ